MNMDFVLAPDDNYARHAAAVVASILAHNPDHHIRIWILDGGLSEENQKKLSVYRNFSNYEVSFLNINPDNFKDFPESGYITRATWYRLKIGELIPETVQKCLYLDCDTIVNSSLAELFALDLTEKCAAVGIDCIFEKFLKNHRNYFPSDYQYFNAGVILFNLQEWRAQSIEKDIMDFVVENPRRLKLLDQTILNIFLRGKTVDFGIKYNFQFTPKVLCETSYSRRKLEYRSAAPSPAIIHFVGEFKPWKIGYNALNPYYRLYLAALSETEWRMSAEETAAFEEESEREKGKIFYKMLFKQIKRKPWWIFRKYFWNRIFL